jgi:branched-chain amino acid aminotransferase
MQYIWHNGRFIPEKNATFPLLAHGLNYGTSVFEGVRAYQTKDGSAVFRLREHVDRFFRGMRALHMNIPWSKRELADAILETVRKNNLSECYIRPLAFYDSGLGLVPLPEKAHVAVAVRPWGAYLGDKPISLTVSPYTRFNPSSVAPGLKIGGYYATSVLVSFDAHRRGFGEGLMLDKDGFVAEGAGENIFFVKNGKLIVPSSASILPGITRASVIKIAKDLGIAVAFKEKVRPAELLRADEAFLTGTATEIAAVSRIDSHKFGNGKAGHITSLIRDTFVKAVHGEVPRYRKWLSFV